MKSILGTMRLPFLVLPPVCVLLGVAAAVWTYGRVNLLYALLALVGALASHIGVNVFNEYFDYRSGLDSKTHKTPFSGGSGSLQTRPDMARKTFLTACIACGITALIGVYFLFVRGPAVLLIGILGLGLAYTYTPWVTRHPWLCLIAPGVGFGTLWVVGTSFVLTGETSWTAWMASFVPFFLVSDLLLLNQFPDVEADRSVGRRHLPISIGRKASSLIYGGFLLLSYLSILAGVLVRALPVYSLFGLSTIFLAVPAFLGARRFARDIPRLIPSMGLNVLVNILTPLLVAIGLIVGRSLS